MTEFKTGPIRFTDEEVSSLKDSEFKRYLQYIIDETKHIKLPKGYNRNCTSEYMNGFKNYLDLCLNRPINNLTESDVFYIAVVAYKYNTEPLVYCDLQNSKSLSDTYYWFYLAHTKYFRNIMEIEMYRRRIISNLELVDLSTVSLEYCKEDKDNIIKPGVISYSEVHRVLGENTINTNLNMPMETILHYESGIKQLIDKILKAGGTIAGGFVNNLINPVYKVYSRSNFCTSPINNNIELAIPQKLANFTIKRSDYIKYSKDPDIVEDSKLLEHFNNMNLSETPETVCLAKQNFYKDNFGQLFALELVSSRDMDVFVIGEDYLEKVRKIIDAIYFNGTNYISNIHHTESSISFTFYNMIKVQIIKRAYKDVEEILGGFDLNPSKAALISDAEGKWKIVAPRAYIDAVTYGVNVVVPCWQSETFNSRLSKYKKKGYDIYLPGNIIERFKLNERRDTQAKSNLTELITFVGDPHKWNMRDLSDYDSKSLEYLVKYRGVVTDLLGIEQRAPLILSGERNPNLSDLFYAYNQTTKLYSNYSFERYELLIKISSIFWRITDPSTQLTGSFNPTKLDYLSGEVREVTVRVEDEGIKTTTELLYQELAKRPDFFNRYG